MPVHLHNLQGRSLDLALQVMADGYGDRDIVGALNDGARYDHALEDVPVVAEEYGSGHAQCGAGLHPLEVVPELLDGDRVVSPDDGRDKALGPCVEIGPDVGEHGVDGCLVKASFVVSRVYVPAIYGILPVCLCSYL